MKELADAIRKMPSEAGQSDLADDEIVDMIENMFEEADTRVPKEAKKELDNLRGEYDPEEYRKKVDAQIEVMKRTNKEFVDKFLEIYGSNTEE